MRSSSCWASVTWVCCCARFAFASSSARCAWLTSASDFFSEACEIAGIHHRDDLAGRYHIAFVDKKFRDTAGKLGVDVDLVSFEAAISRGDSGRQPRLMLMPPQPADARAGADHQQQRYNRDTRSPPPLWPRRRLLDDGRETAALLVRRRPQLDGWITALRFLLGHRNACSGTSGPIPLSGDLDEIGVTKPLAVVENGNDLRRNPEQDYLVQLSRRVRRDLGKLLEHQLRHLVYLSWIGDRLRPAADRQTTDFVPAGIRQVDRERDLGVAGDVFRFLRFAAQPK